MSPTMSRHLGSVNRLRLFLTLIAVGNLLVGVIWVKISYDTTGIWSAPFNLGLLILLCGVAAVRCLTMTIGMTRPDPDAKHRADDAAPGPVSEQPSDDAGDPVGSAAPPPPSRA